MIVDDTELRGFRRAAKRAGMTLSEWVRQTLRRAERDADVGDPRRKLEAIRRALQVNGPTADIEEMLADIERGQQQDLE